MPKLQTKIKGQPESTHDVLLGLTSRKTSPEIEAADMMPDSRAREKYPDIRKACRYGCKKYYSHSGLHYSQQGKESLTASLQCSVNRGLHRSVADRTMRAPVRSFRGEHCFLC
jgi:hypothetical protein